MAKISNFRLNTHFTALRQLPDKYQASFNIGGSYGYVLGQVLGSAIITVPAGAYVETPLLRCSIDGNINHLAHEFGYTLNTLSDIYFSINQISSNQYQVRALLNNTSSSTVTVPSSTVTAILRLADAPFDV